MSMPKVMETNMWYLCFLQNVGKPVSDCARIKRSPIQVGEYQVIAA